MKKLCIFHSVDGTNHCDDGFAAAWAVNHWNPGVYDFHPGVYQQPPPDVTDRDVLLVDFSYKRPVLEEMVAKARSVTILDHHATAQDDLGPLLESGAIKGEFDMDRCGSRMTWDHFSNGSEPPPALLAYVEDRDLWRKALPDGDEVIMALRSYPKTFHTWDGLMFGDGINLLRLEGKAIHRYYRMVVDGLKANVQRRDVGGVEVPAVNCPMMFASEVAGEIADPDTFGACYWDNADGSRTFSLRSRGDFHVGEFAAGFGGGGHKGAAGFTLRVQGDRS